jgi:hypothetical protein
MTEQKNPFLEENYATGGGLWDDKTVTITGAKTMIDWLKRGDGTPYLNEDGSPAFRNVLCITGVADDEEAERRETYSVGSIIPSPDGLSFVDPTGKPVRFHTNCELAKFANNIRAGGFDVSTLYDTAANRPVFHRLVGARFVFKGETQHDKDGNPKKNAKGYIRQKFYPIQFVGYKEGLSAPQTASAPDTIREKAAEVILAVLAEADGKIGRADMVRKVTGKMAGDKDANKVLALVTRDDFHKDQPWKRDASGFSL